MILDFYYKSALLFFYFFQGLIFTSILLARGYRNSEPSSRWLALLIFLSCLYVCPWMLGHAGWYAKDGYREFLFFIPFQQFYLIGPVIYFYVRSLLSEEKLFSRKDYKHFLPAFLYLVYSFIVFVTDTLLLEEFYFYSDGRDKDLAPWYQISGIGFIILYLLASLRLYNRYRSKIFNELSYAE